MSLLALNGYVPLINPSVLPEITTLSTFALDATGETTGDGIATVFTPLAGKTISALRAYYSAVTGVSPTYRIKLETLSAGRTPSNTPATASCWVDVTPAGAAGWVGGAVVANHSVGADPTSLAVTIRYNSGTCDASNFATFARGWSLAGDIYSPYTLTMTAGTWGSATTGSNVSFIVVEYDDGTIQPLCFYGSGTTLLANNSPWGTGTAPLYRGNAWTPPVSCEVCGVWIAARLPDTFDFRVNVYDGSTLIEQTGTFEADKLIATSSSAFPTFIPLTTFTHPANTKYGYFIEPTVAVNPTAFIHAIFASRPALRAFSDLVGATMTSGLSLTTYDNGTDGYRLYPIVPVISKVEGGGGSRNTVI